jgi:hypothetical protein
MIKKFQSEIPLPFEKSHELLVESGKTISSWKLNNSDPNNGYIEWKQSFWALTGTTSIIAVLEKKDETTTSVVVNIHKPMQVVDPIGILNRVYRKLENAWMKKLDDFRVSQE